VSLDHVRPVLAEALREFIAALGGAAKVFMYHLGLHFGREIAAALSAVRHREVVERPLLILRGSGLGKGGAGRVRVARALRDPRETRSSALA